MRGAGEFQHHLGTDGVGIAVVDHVLESRRNQQVTFLGDHVVDALDRTPDQAHDRLPLLLGREKLVDIKTISRGDRVAGVGYGNNHVSVGRELAGNVLAGVAETLNGNAHARRQTKFPRQCRGGAPNLPFLQREPNQNREVGR